jgi:MFS family permease
VRTSGKIAGDEGGAVPEQVGAGVRAWLALGILLFFNVLGYIDRSILSLMVEPVKAGLHITDLQIGIAQGLAFAIFFALCGLPIGWALDRFSRRPIVFAGVVIWSIASAACGLAENFAQLLVARFAVGIGEATLMPASFAIIAGLFPRHQLGRALSIFSLGASIGLATAMLAGGAIVEFANDSTLHLGAIASEPWRMVFLLTGAPGVLFAGLIFAVPERTIDRRKTSGGSDGFWDFVRTRRKFLACHFMGFSLLGLVAVGTAAWLPTYLFRQYGWSAGQAGTGMALITVFSSVGVVLSGISIDHLVRKGIKNAHMLYEMAATTAALALGMAAFMFATGHLVLFVLGLSMAFIAMSGVAASCLQIVTPAPYRSRISAAYLVVVNIVGTGGGPLAIAIYTDYVFADEGKIGLSLLVNLAVTLPLAFLCFFLGRKFMLEAAALMPDERPGNA